ncbi:guanylate kinase [Erythrobacter sp. NAP1]|uniref:hypothetical protein n=1 Tax=Erythrobacter sp. NAP1 TaxID=237727 RepID=UPI0000685129|nr:hypothetical protein [Erythrobacter sp. NAP1]EAQ27919.1 guanylate kinase [Erythrobacter sp. NAP1]
MSEKRSRRARDYARDKASKLKDEALGRDSVARELVRPSADAKANSRIPVPSTNPATNLVIAEIIMRGASTLFRQNVERQVAKASYGDEGKAREVLDGRTIVTSLALYGASKLATRSPLGLGVVTGALVAKTLYDRGKSRQLRKRREGAAKLTSSEE